MTEQTHERPQLWTPADNRNSYTFKTATSSTQIDDVTHIEFVPGYVLFYRDDLLLLASNARFTFDIRQVVDDEEVASS